MVQSLSCCWMFGRNILFYYLQLQDASDCTTLHCHDPRRWQYESVSELAIFEPNLHLHKNPSNLVPVILPVYTTYDDGTEYSVPKHWHIKFRPRGFTQRKNTTFRTRSRFEIKNVYLELRSPTNSSTRALKNGSHIWQNTNKQRTDWNQN
jgi:hypothetical protein